MNGIGGFGQLDPSQFARMREEFLKSADADGDGAISQTEFGDALSINENASNSVSRLFDRFDTSGDGSISQEEALAVNSNYADRLRGHGMGPMMRPPGGESGGLFGDLDQLLADAGEGGSISQDAFGELLADKGVPTDKVDELFGKLDADGDGSLSQEEVETAKESFAQQMGGPKGPPPPPPEGGPQQLLSDLEGLLSNESEDASTISQEAFSELLADKGVSSNLADELFGKLDADGDGSISQEEIDAEKEKVAAREQQRPSFGVPAFMMRAYSQTMSSSTDESSSVFGAVA